MKNNDSKNLTIGLASIFVYFFFHFFSSSLLRLVGINVSNLSDTKKVIISTMIMFFILIILIIINYKRLLQNFKDYKKNFLVLIKRNFKYWACAVLIMFVSNLIIGLLFNRLTSANDEGVREIFKVSPILMIIEAVILAPICEELVFRESIKNIFKKPVLYIIISGIIFGFMHTLASLSSLADFLYIIPYSVPGFFFAYMLYKEDNVLVPITFHMLHNCMSVILLIISKLLGIL